MLRDRKKFGVIVRGTASALAVFLFSGCVSRKVEFTSTPKGAAVFLGKEKGITPCILKVPKGVDKARYVLPSGEELSLTVPNLDNAIEDANDGTRTVAGMTLKVVGGVTALVGAGVAFITILPLYGTGEESLSYDDDRDYLNVMFGGLGLLGLGAGVYFVGDWIYPEQIHPVLHADFGWPQELLFEDRGYGAKRLKFSEE